MANYSNNQSWLYHFSNNSAFIAPNYGIRSIFIFLIISTCINFLIFFIIFTNPENKIKSTKIDSQKPEQNFDSMKRLLDFSSICVLVTVLGYSHGLIGAIWSLYLRQCGAEIWLINLSYTVYAIPIILISSASRTLGIYNFLRMEGNFIGALLSTLLYTKSIILPFTLSSILMLVSSLIAGASLIKERNEIAILDDSTNL